MEKHTNQMSQTLTRDSASILHDQCVVKIRFSSSSFHLKHGIKLKTHTMATNYE